MNSIIVEISVIFLPIMVAVILHEYAHGWVAEKRGDPTARIMGRLTLNPLPHIDIFGTILLPIIFVLLKSGIIFGYAKPVPVNFMNLKKPKEDMVLVAAAGPITNFLLAFLSGLLFKIISLIYPEILFSLHLKYFSSAHKGVAAFVLIPFGIMLIKSVFINVILAIINLMPIPPLDGGRILVGLLPYPYSEKIERIEPFGIFIFLAILFLDPFGIYSNVIGNLIFLLIRLFLWI